MNRQRLSMTKPPVASQIHQSLDVHGDLSSEFPFDLVFVVDYFSDVVYLVAAEIVCFDAWINVEPIQDFSGSRSADAINIGQPDLDPFLPW